MLIVDFFFSVSLHLIITIKIKTFQFEQQKKFLISEIIIKTN